MDHTERRLANGRVAQGRFAHLPQRNRVVLQQPPGTSLARASTPGPDRAEPTVAALPRVTQPPGHRDRSWRAPAVRLISHHRWRSGACRGRRSSTAVIGLDLGEFGQQRTRPTTINRVTRHRLAVVLNSRIRCWKQDFVAIQLFVLPDMGPDPVGLSSPDRGALGQRPVHWYRHRRRGRLLWTVVVSIRQPKFAQERVARVAVTLNSSPHRKYVSA